MHAGMYVRKWKIWLNVVSDIKHYVLFSAVFTRFLQFFLLNLPTSGPPQNDFRETYPPFGPPQPFWGGLTYLPINFWTTP